MHIGQCTLGITWFTPSQHNFVAQLGNFCSFFHLNLLWWYEAAESATKWRVWASVQEEKTGEKAATAVRVDLYGMIPPIEKMEPALNALVKCEYVKRIKHTIPGTLYCTCLQRDVYTVSCALGLLLNTAVFKLGSADQRGPATGSQGVRERIPKSSHCLHGF